MGTWRMDDIRRAYERGEEKGASHMLVVWDPVFSDNGAIYVKPGEDPQAVLRLHEGDLVVDECYRYSLGWEAQSKERRAQHWEWEPVDTSVVG